VNFFGHAVSACWSSDDPAFVLGAMLPDFASMCRGKIASVGDERTAAGVDFHHRCDAVFHRAPVFRELMSWLERALRDQNVRKGGSRGAAHVGIELLLDGALIADPAARRLYPLALGHAGDADVSWRDDAHAQRWSSLLVRLADHGLPVGYADTAIVGKRIAQILSNRPLLALTDAESVIVTETLSEASVKVRERADELCGFVAGQLGLTIRQQR